MAAARKKSKGKKPAAGLKVKKAAKSAPKKLKPKKKATSTKVKTATKVKTKPAAAKASKMPAVGDKAPPWTLPSSGGGTISLNDFRGRSHVVLYFYPKDDTPGCTVEACAFRDDTPKFADASTVVLGISPDSTVSHDKFRQKFGLPFPLLADEGARVAAKYGVWVEKNMYGRKYMGVQRATFLIDQDGKIAAVWPKVSVDGHSGEVFEAIGRLG